MVQMMTSPTHMRRHPEAGTPNHWSATPHDILLQLETPSIGRMHHLLYGTGAFRKTEDDTRANFRLKEDPETLTKEYRELERILDKMEDAQKITYLKKRLTSHICSVYMEHHPELGLVADEDPKMVSELHKRIHRISSLLDDSPLYSPFLRGMNLDTYTEPGWRKRQNLAQPYINDIRTLYHKIQGKPVNEALKFSEIELSNMIYEDINRSKSAILPEVFILRGMHYYNRIQKTESLKYASEKDLSILRSNHGNFRYALKYIARGIYAGALSPFFIVTFGGILDQYIQNYRTWLRIEITAIQFSERMEVDSLRNRVARHDETLKNIRRNSRNLPLLRRMYSWFPDEFRYSRVKLSEITAAIKNYENKEFNKKVKGIKSRQLVSLFINLTLFLAGSPLMRLSILLIRELKTTDKDIQLRLRMIQTTQMQNNYYRMLRLGGRQPTGQG